jgi:hypothetical protein
MVCIFIFSLVTRMQPDVIRGLFTMDFILCLDVLLIPGRTRVTCCLTLDYPKNNPDLKAQAALLVHKAGL